MDDFVSFDGKSIDDAIEAACQYFNAEREKLELEIMSDSKSGIFGLVGGKKAQVKARLRTNGGDLRATIETIVEKLVKPVIGAEFLDMDILIEQGRAKVTINDDENSGLLIGREGQTLSALQYLANRIAAKKIKEPMRIQIDTGDYRERQDDNLRQLAFFLADKVKTQGRPQSTKPLSSYHRRVVHMALQSDETVVTRSKGDGPLKRVLILPKRGERKARNN